jgi:glycosyltransferase involved in cell wall biosynthesis
MIAPVPFGLAFGGRERLAAGTLQALMRAGVDARPVDPWELGFDYDVLHLFGAEAPLWDTAMLAARRGVPLVVTSVLSIRPMPHLARRWKHVDRIVPMKTSFRFRRELLGAAQVVVAATETEGALLRSMYDVPPGRVVVIPNGIDDEFFAPDPGVVGPAVLPDRYVLSVGVISALKGQLHILEAARRVGIRAVFVGEMRDRMDPHNAAFAQAMERGDAIWLQGLSTAQLAAVNAGAEAFVLASRSEGLPLAALEAQAAGARLVLTDLAQHHEVFGASAEYCRWGDAADIARAITAAVNRPAGRQHPAAWTWGAVAQALSEIYARAVR